jgi:hypothetical protein
VGHIPFPVKFANVVNDIVSLMSKYEMIHLCQKYSIRQYKMTDRREDETKKCEKNK